MALIKLIIFQISLFFSLHSHCTSGCILVKSERRNAVLGGIIYSSPISGTTAAQAWLFSVTWENRSTCEAPPSSVRSDCVHSCSSSATRGSSLAISQSAASLQSWEGRGSWDVSVSPLRYPSDWAESTKALVPSRIMLLICYHRYIDISCFLNNTFLLT